MAFSEAVKCSAKRKAHFKCCICRRPSVSLEAHHIIQQADGGTDDEDNAVPLCPTCHAEYGANLEKRTAIRVQRDFWYEVCERRYVLDSEMAERLAQLLERTTAAVTGFQDYVNRIVKPEVSASASQSHALSGTSSGMSSASGTLSETARVDATGKVLPGEARAEESTVHATVTNPEDEWDEEEDFQQEFRTEIEILEALDKLFDQIWYNRHWNFRAAIEEGRKKVSPEVLRVALAAAARVEKKYKDDPEALGPWSDFEWGMLNGKNVSPSVGSRG